MGRRFFVADATLFLVYRQDNRRAVGAGQGDVGNTVRLLGHPTNRALQDQQGSHPSSSQAVLAAGAYRTKDRFERQAVFEMPESSLQRTVSNSQNHTHFGEYPVDTTK